VSFNEEQREHMRELARQPRETLCWCAWYDLGHCPNGCNEHGQSAAERAKVECPECHNYPGAPGMRLVHNKRCSHSTPAQGGPSHG
jgi:hypothetical protein